MPLAFTQRHFHSQGARGWRHHRGHGLPGHRLGGRTRASPPEPARARGPARASGASAELGGQHGLGGQRSGSGSGARARGPARASPPESVLTSISDSGSGAAATSGFGIGLRFVRGSGSIVSGSTDFGLGIASSLSIHAPGLLHDAAAGEDPIRGPPPGRAPSHRKDGDRPRSQCSSSAPEEKRNFGGRDRSENGHRTPRGGKGSRKPGT